MIKNSSQRQRTGVSALHGSRGERLDTSESVGGVGVLRLRSCFASRSGYFAQDDNVYLCCEFRGPAVVREETGGCRASLGLDDRGRSSLHDHTNRESRGDVELIPLGQ